MVLKIYWYETGVLSTAKSAAAIAIEEANRLALQRRADQQAQADKKQANPQTSHQAEIIAAQGVVPAYTFQNSTPTAESITAYYKSLAPRNRSGSERTASAKATNESYSDALGGTLNNPTYRGVSIGGSKSTSYSDALGGTLNNPTYRGVSIGGSKSAPTLIQQRTNEDLERQKQTSTSEYAYDEGGTITYRQKKYFPRESRQKIKDFLKSNPAEFYRITDDKGKFITQTSGRNVYPDILKFSLSNKISILPVTKLKSNQSYLALGVGNQLYTIEQPDYKIFPTLPPTKPEKQGPNKPLLVQLPVSPDQPYTNKDQKRLNNLLGKNINIKRTYNEAIPFLSGIENLGIQIASIGIAAKQPLQYGTLTSFDKGTREAKKFYEQNKAPIYPAGSRKDIQQQTGEFAGFTALGSGLVRLGEGAITKIGTYITESKLVKQATKDFTGILAPKQVVPAKLTQKIKVSPATGLSKDTGVPFLTNTKIRFKPIDESLVRIESESIKQNKLLLYDVNKKLGFAFEGVTKESKLPTSFNLRGPLSDDVTQQIAQQNKFGLTQVGEDLFKSGGKVGQIKNTPLVNIAEISKEANANLIKALESESVAHVSNVKIFSLEQIRNQPREFGRYLFGREPLPTAPMADIGLLESRGYLTGGTRIPKSLSNIFNPFRKSKVKSYTISEKPEGHIKFITTTKHLEKTFFKKLPTASYVTDVQKFIRFVDPFSKSGKSFFGTKINTAMLGTTEKGFGKYPSGKGSQIFTETKQQRDEFSKAILKESKAEMDILFQGPRFKEVYGSIGLGLGTKQMVIAEYENPTKQIDRGLRMIESPQIGNFESAFKINEKTFEIAIPKKSTENKLLTNIIPRLTEGTTPITGLKLITNLIPSLTTEVTPKTTPRLRQETTPELTTELVPELIPDIPFEEPPPPRPFEKIIPTGGLPFYNFGGGSDNEFSGKKSRKIYKLFDIAEIPFGKISKYVGFNIASFTPIEKIKKSRNPIGQPAPSDIFNIKIKNLYSPTRRASKRNTRSKGKRKASSSKYNYGFDVGNLF